MKNVIGWACIAALSAGFAMAARAAAVACDGPAKTMKAAKAKKIADVAVGTTAPEEGVTGWSVGSGDGAALLTPLASGVHAVRLDGEKIKGQVAGILQHLKASGLAQAQGLDPEIAAEIDEAIREACEQADEACREAVADAEEEIRDAMADVDEALAEVDEDMADALAEECEEACEEECDEACEEDCEEECEEECDEECEDAESCCTEPGSIAVSTGGEAGEVQVYSFGESEGEGKAKVVVVGKDGKVRVRDVAKTRAFAPKKHRAQVVEVPDGIISGFTSTFEMPPVRTFRVGGLAAAPAAPAAPRAVRAPRAPRAPSPESAPRVLRTRVPAPSPDAAAPAGDADRELLDLIRELREEVRELRDEVNDLKGNVERVRANVF